MVYQPQNHTLDFKKWLQCIFFSVSTQGETQLKLCQKNLNISLDIRNFIDLLKKKEELKVLQETKMQKLCTHIFLKKIFAKRK